MFCSKAARAQLLVVFVLAGCASNAPQPSSKAADPDLQLVLRGRQLVVEHACGDCHGGANNPAAQGWLQGARDTDTFMVGPFRTYPRNLTPDVETGTGRYTERQIFNALRFGLRPSKTPDVDITSNVPGQGNFPAQPNYLSPDMPWVAWRHMTDDELRAIAAYIKRGLKPVNRRIPDSEGPPDMWASAYTVEEIGPHPAVPYPTDREVPLSDLPFGREQQILRGRQLTISHACAGCHSGKIDPADPMYLGGITKPDQEFKIGPFKTRPRNLTPDNTTGMGRFSERQIFNALRFGLRPGETPDIEITSTTPGEGNHPLNGKYLAPPMPWPSWRHMPDADLWAIAAYLKHGVKPIRNRVEDSEGPPDFWASAYTVDLIGPYPAAPFPTQNEVNP